MDAEALELMQSQTLAAWVQGVGTVLAVGVGAFLVWWEQHVARKEKVQAAKDQTLLRQRHVTELLNAIRLVSETTANYINSSGVTNQASTWKPFAKASLLRMQTLRRGAEDMDLSGVATTMVWLSWAELLREMDRVIEELKDQVEWCNTTREQLVRPDWEDLRELIAHYQSLARDCEATEETLDEETARTLGFRPATEEDVREVIEQGA